MTQIHATAIIDSDAEVDEKVVIGPYCYVGKNVKLGKDVQLLSHVVIEGHTSIGDGTRVFPFASIGYDPQDLGTSNAWPVSGSACEFMRIGRTKIIVETGPKEGFATKNY